MPSLVVQAVASLTAGLACGLTLDPRSLSHAPLLVVAALVVGLLAHAHRRPMLAGGALAIAGSALAAMHGAGALDRALHPPLRAVLDARFGGFDIDRPVGTRLETPLVVEGRLRQDVVPAGDGLVARLDVARVWVDGRAVSAAGGVSLGISGAMGAARARDWTAGTLLRAPAILSRPNTYRNRGLADQERALARRGTTLVGTIKSAALVEVTAHAPWWQAWAASVRWRVRDAVARWLAPDDGPAAAVAAAILIGDRSALDSGIERSLQEAGTYHVVAISGGNVAIFAGLVLGTLGLAGWRGRGAASLGMLTVLAYGGVAEGGASVSRATTIAVIYLGVRLIDLRTPPVQALALAAIGMLVVAPLAIADVGFWLTFGASTAIVLGASRVPWTGAWHSVPVGILCASVAVEVVLAPIAALAFERITVAGLALNFVAIPAMTLVQVGAMALVAADTLGIESGARMGALLARAGATALLESPRLIEVAPWLTWRVPAPSPIVMAAYYAAVGVWWSLSTPPIDTRVRRQMTREAGRMALVLGVIILVKPQDVLRAAGDGRLHFTVFDVGQGDASLVTFPNGRTLLVDAGGLATGSFDIGERVLGPALRARGLRRIDYVAVTHADPDHIGGALSIVRDFAPREVWVGVDVAGHGPTERLREAAAARRAAWRSLRRGDLVEIGGVAVRVLNPPPPEWERRRVRNDDSLVLDLRFQQIGLLLTGDISRAVERELLPQLDRALVTILKVPHHGSATSSSPDLVSALRPTLALIGVGRGNLYGHPVPAVLERYQSIAADVLRTDRDGQIDVVTDGQRVEVKTYRGEKDSHEGHEGHEG